MILKRYETHTWHEGFLGDEVRSVRHWSLKAARAEWVGQERAVLGLLSSYDVSVYPPRRIPPDEFSLRFARSLRGSIMDRRTGEVIEQRSILDRT